MFELLAVIIACLAVGACFKSIERASDMAEGWRRGR